jgi:hypothetical protein
MRRVFLGMGDKAGEAVIMEGLPDVSCSNPPPLVQISTLYMRTWCNACNQDGFIGPRGFRWDGTASNGQQWALSGDINVCGCSPPPIFHAERNMAQVFDADEGALFGRGNSPIQPAQIARGAFDQYFRLTDQRTGKPLRGVPYRIVTEDDEEFEGHTDSQGHTLRVSNVWDSSATLHVLQDETPINPDWDRYL